MVRQLAYSTELLVCINEALQTIQTTIQGGGENLLNSTQLSLALSFLFSLCFSLFQCYTGFPWQPLLIAEVGDNYLQLWSNMATTDIATLQPLPTVLAAIFDAVSSHC